MFLERIWISSLWNAGLICGMLGLKRLLRGRLSLRFQYESWYVLLGSLLLTFLPGGLWEQWQFSRPVGQQTFLLPSANPNPASGIAGGGGWISDTTELTGWGKNDQIAYLLLMIWLAGVLVLAGVYLCGSCRLRRIKRFSSRPSIELQSQFDACRRKLHLKQKAELRQSGLVSAPVSFGWGKAWVVLPEEGLENLSAAEREHVLLHELIHIRHGDFITNYLFCGAQALFWFHPLVWLAFRQMRRDREAYCDWAVLKELDDELARIGYGQTLLRFAAGGTRFHTANGLCQSREQLKYRLEQIVGFQRETKGKRRLGRCLAVFLALASLGQLPMQALCAENTGEYYALPDTVSMTEGDWAALFGDTNGCAVLYDLNAERYTVYNEREITRRVPPCSTFKIYSALNALEQGIITPEDSELHWDGAQQAYPAWNRDHDLSSAMGESVNWYFQALDQAAGARQLSEFYRRIGYGNGQVRSDPANYWNGSALKISALEQVELLVKLYRNAFGFRDENISAVREAIAISDSGGFRLYGKTGTGKVGEENVAGWFVGFLETADNTLFFAVYLCGDEGADGTGAARIAMDILNNTAGYPA